jgi:NADH-quinone oxidoreductase subunit L
MTRCVYLTFFGEYRGHGHPHESPKAITVPLLVLAFFSIVAGLANAPFTNYWFAHLITNETAIAGGITEHPFSFADAAISTVVVLASIAIGYALFFQQRQPKGVTERVPAARLGYTFLANRYYLDALWSGVVVGSIKGPIANAAYWFNQHILDGVVNGVATTARAIGRWLYGNVDQRGIDGAVNGSGLGASAFGGFLRNYQTGRVQQYGSLLFGATALLAIALVLTV